MPQHQFPDQLTLRISRHPAQTAQQLGVMIGKGAVLLGDGMDPISETVAESGIRSLSSLECDAAAVLARHGWNAVYLRRAFSFTDGRPDITTSKLSKLSVDERNNARLAVEDIGVREPQVVVARSIDNGSRVLRLATIVAANATITVADRPAPPYNGNLAKRTLITGGLGKSDTRLATTDYLSDPEVNALRELRRQFRAASGRILTERAVSDADFSLESLGRVPVPLRPRRVV